MPQPHHRDVRLSAPLGSQRLRRAMGGLIGLVLGGLLLGAPARASTMLDLDVEGLTARAELVVRAKVVGQESRRTRGGGRIVTETELEILEVLDGAPKARKVRVLQPGGTLGGVVQEVIGAARFAPGEEVVVFLRPVSGGASARVVGMALGKFHVERRTGAPVRVRRDGLSKVRVLEPQTHVEREAAQDQTLTSLRQRVRAAGRRR